ncbi:MAG: hypothetical protein OJK14_02885 [Achromobacter sp.]|uniref:hypothetical protein n=1 Tax=Achromobacter sp. TaxID=134375 RepID=UPI00258368F3|nr:hypothetical protein [Achromobacter sp.]MCW0206014.1 hypothetical protein [Achromobacter sp.]
MGGFEFEPWMFAAVALLVVAALIYWWLQVMAARHPNAVRALSIGFGSLVMLLALGWGYAGIPLDVREVCANTPNQCISYLIETSLRVQH